MESAGQFERLIRMVQETGERVVVSFEKSKDPVVLLPLSVYEQLTGRQGQEGGGRLAVQVPRRREPEEIGQMGGGDRGNGLKSFRTDMARTESFRAEAPRIDAQRPRRNPDVNENVGNGLKPFPTDDAAADAWDGEDSGEYDAERIFAQIDREKMNNAPSQVPDRLRASVSRASEALHEGWSVGNGGQRLPIRNQSLQGEERFSLGAG
jgi:hypothetical protein